MRLIWLIRLYPKAWRARYGEEMAAVLEQHRPTTATWLSLLFGALDAHLHTAALTGNVTPMLQRLRSSAITAFCAFVIFGLAVGFLGRTADPHAPFAAVAKVHPEVGIAYSIINRSFTAGSLLLLIGGIPVILSAFRRTVLRDRRNPFALFALRWRAVLWLYLGSLALVLGYIVFTALSRVAGGLPPFPTLAPAQIPLFLVAMLALALVPFIIALVTALISIAVWRSDISAGVLRFARIPALLLALSMLTGLIATCFWTARLWIDDRAFFNSDAGLSGGWPMLIIIPMMLIAVLLAGSAVRRGWANQPESVEPQVAQA